MHTQLHVAIDIGSQLHRVAIGRDDGALIEEFDCAHTLALSVNGRNYRLPNV